MTKSYSTYLSAGWWQWSYGTHKIKIKEGTVSTLQERHKTRTHVSRRGNILVSFRFVSFRFPTKQISNRTKSKYKRNESVVYSPCWIVYKYHLLVYHIQRISFSTSIKNKVDQFCGPHGVFLFDLIENFRMASQNHLVFLVVITMVLLYWIPFPIHHQINEIKVGVMKRMRRCWNWVLLGSNDLLWGFPTGCITDG